MGQPGGGGAEIKWATWDCSKVLGIPYIASYVCIKISRPLEKIKIIHEKLLYMLSSHAMLVNFWRGNVGSRK